MSERILDVWDVASFDPELRDMLGDHADLLPARADESDLGDADPIVDARLADVMLLGSRR